MVASARLLIAVRLALAAGASGAVAAQPALVPKDVPLLGRLPQPLVADAPPAAQPNWGIPGFHADDGSVNIEVEVADATAPRTLEEEEAAAALWDPLQLRFDYRKTADGWVFSAAHAQPTKDGRLPHYTFRVRRTLEGRAYTCYGGVEKREWLDPNIAICESLRPKPK